MIESFFLFFTGLWALIAVGVILSIVYTICVEQDEYAWAMGMTVIGVILCHKWLFGLPWTWWGVAIGIVAYGVAGALWSLYRWYKYCNRVVTEHPYKDRPSYLQPSSVEEYYQHLLNLREHKSTIMGWIVLWPWSLLWNITGDFFTFIYDSLKGIYTRIAEGIVRRAITPKE